MEVTGKIIYVLPEQSGTSKSGNAWRKREYVLETQDNSSFPRKIHFDFFGDRADQYPLNAGDQIKLSFDIESREYNGRWYTSIRGWKAEPIGTVPPTQDPLGPIPTQGPFNGSVPPPPVPTDPVPNDDLPF